MNILNFLKLDGEIDATTPTEFEDQFRAILRTPLSRNHRNIVYRWVAAQPIPRMRGASRVIYIGKTKNSLFERHHRYAKVEARGNNWLRYEHIIKQYGAITFECAQCENPRLEEKKLLDDYFQDHLEVPPINSVK